MAHLRAEWNDADLRFVLRNERLLALFDAEIKNPRLGQARWSQRLSLVYQREFSYENDFYHGMVHPRDLDLHPLAYGALEKRVFLMLKDGELKADPTWPERFPELYNYDPDNLPKVKGD